jgi:hypothetical protein
LGTRVQIGVDGIGIGLRYHVGEHRFEGRSGDDPAGNEQRQGDQQQTAPTRPPIGDQRRN